MRTHPIENYQTLRDSAPCLSRAATLPKGTKLGLGKRRAPGNTIILSQPYRRRVSTDRLNREGSQLAASLEGEPGPTPAGKTLPHSFPETSRFRRERARNPKNNYSPALQEDARFEVLVIFPVSARQFGIKDMLDGPAGVEDFLGGIVWVITRVV